jgi:hypothetical protein
MQARRAIGCTALVQFSLSALLAQDALQLRAAEPAIGRARAQRFLSGTTSGSLQIAWELNAGASTVCADDG